MELLNCRFTVAHPCSVVLALECDEDTLKIGLKSAVSRSLAVVSYMDSTAALNSETCIYIITTHLIHQAEMRHLRGRARVNTSR